MEINLREIQLKDLEQYLYWNNPKRKFHSFNGPYFKQKTKNELEEYVKSLESKLLNNEDNVLENKKLIVDENDNLIGEVNWYWKSEETLWMEVGIVIFNEEYWGKGIGYIALKKWINEIFTINPKIVRLGLTTWSGNIGMMKLAEKLGLQKEAEYRKARIVDGKYYNSVSYGILREDWDNKTIKIGIQEPYKSFLINGKKIFEGRLNKGKFSNIDLGDIIEIDNTEYRFKVIDLSNYDSFKNFLLSEGLKNVLPDKENIKEGLDVYYNFYSKEDEIEYGVLSIKLERLF